MIKTALMMAAVLAAASPAGATVGIPIAGYADSLVPQAAAPVIDVVYARSWVSPAWGKLVVVSEAEMTSTADSAAAPLPTDETLPEPMRWAMIVVGVAIIGWLTRTGNRTPVSFV